MQQRHTQQQHGGQGSSTRQPGSTPIHEQATAQQIADAPAGTMAHRNYLCPSLNTERLAHAPNAMRQRAANFAAGNLAFERAIHPSINHTVDPPATDASFTWIVFPTTVFFCGRVYTDGSRLDGPTPLLARNGWAFVVLNEADEIIASAHGVPPNWVDDIPGTEAWALTQAGYYAEPGCTFFVDCEPCVKAFHAGAVLSCADNKPLARVHTLMHDALDHIPAASVIWMPAHLKPNQCGTVIRGDGFLLTEIDVWANDQADRLAKRRLSSTESRSECVRPSRPTTNWSRPTPCGLPGPVPSPTSSRPTPAETRRPRGPGRRRQPLPSGSRSPC